MADNLPLAKPDIDESDLAAVAEVLRSGRLALGPKAEEFERKIADYVGVAHAVAVSSGTAALHLVVRALGLKKGDDVLVPSFTFAASVNVLFYEGVTPVFVDINPDDYNLDLADAAQKITPRTKAVLAVDVFGHPAQWDKLEALAERHGLYLIDDACEALGSSYNGARLGRFGNAATFAFYPNKQMTTGEGGMIVTNDGKLAALCRSLCNQGRDGSGAWLSHARLGYNYRMDEMSAALGVSQLKRLDTFLEKRARVAKMYTERLAAMNNVRPPITRTAVQPSWFVYVVTLTGGQDRDDVIRRLDAQGIPARAYFPSLHTQPYVRDLIGGAVPALPVTEKVAARTLALPFHNNLSAADVDRVVAALRSALGAAKRAS